MNDIIDERAATLAAIDAAIANPRLWPEALESVTLYLRASFATLVHEDRSSALLELRHSSRAQKLWLTEYLRNHRKLDPERAHLIEKLGVGRVFSAADFIEPQRFHQSMIFQRWLEPHNLIDAVGAILHRSASGVCIFIAFRSTAEGPIDAEAKFRLERILPKLTEAVSLGERVAESAFRASQLFQLFEQLVAPVIILDRQMRIKQCNDSARMMLEEHPMLAAANGALIIDDARAREALEQALRTEEPLAARSCAILLRRGEEKCCVMHVLRLTHGEAAILVRSLAARSDASGEVVTQLYGLTARERSVLLAIADVGGVPAAARALGLTESTVKGYLKSIFQKTGAQRQADLVKLVLALESPFSTTRAEECVQ